MQQDCELLRIEENSVAFKRKIDTCDPQDFKMHVNMNKNLLFAMFKFIVLYWVGKKVILVDTKVLCQCSSGCKYKPKLLSYKHNIIRLD